MKKKLKNLETQFFAYSQMRRLLTVPIGDLGASLLHMTPDQERKLLSRLSRGGLIARVRQGLYLVPPQLPLGCAWTPSEALALKHTDGAWRSSTTQKPATGAGFVRTRQHAKI